MTETDLFNDRMFFTLFQDAWKARKDAGMGPMRLRVMLDYLDRVRGNQTPVARNPKPVPEPIEETATAEDLVRDSRTDAAQAQDVQRRLLSAALSKLNIQPGQGATVHMPDDFDASAITVYLQEVGGQYVLSSDDGAVMPSKFGGWDFVVVRNS